LFTNRKIRVLIADDSAFMRKVLQSILSANPLFEVAGEARDGQEAVTLSESLKPDVITMDINMPHTDGMKATEIIMSTNPRPIVIVSSESRDGADITLRALELGAIDFVAKPSGAIDLDMSTVCEELCRKLKTAAKVRVVRTAARARSAAVGAVPSNGNGSSSMRVAVPAERSPQVFTPTMPKPNGRFPIVVVAASTGGPATLMRFVPIFPREFPGAVLLVQHMPGTFTTQFSRQLAEASSIRVKEAEVGEIVQPATLYVCPGSHHMRISPTGRITLDDGPRISGYRPCADVTLETAGAFAGPMTIGVVLTGMGSDGARGAQMIKSAGGHVIVQDEASCVIFGMPAEAIRAGAVDQVLNIDAIYPAIEKRVLYVHGAARVGAI
jgi:two-component system, chemotaxis family, protein-glutamate methylesterase/glutaminase